MGLRDKARETATKDSLPEESEAPKAPPEQSPPTETANQETTPPAPSYTQLEESMTYLVEEERPDIAYSLFKSASAHGMRGMIISRTYPKNLRKSLDLGNIPVFWLTNAMSDEAIGPKDLERLTLAIRRFMEEDGGNLVLIDSLEYVITNNKFVSVLRLLQTIRDMVAIHKAIGIVSLKASTLEPARLASVQRELEMYSADKSLVRPAQPEPDTHLITELKQDEIIIEAGRIEEERKNIGVQRDKLAGDLQKMLTERQELEKERQEVRQTLVRVRQTRKELENFRIKLTKEEAELTSKVRAKFAKEMQGLDSKRANLEMMEKEVESRYQQLDRIVGLKTEQKLFEVQGEKKRLDEERRKLADLMAKIESDRNSAEESLRKIQEKEAAITHLDEETKTRDKNLQEREHAMALDKVEFEKRKAAADTQRNELERLRKRQEDEASQMKAEVSRLAADVSQREQSVSTLTHELEMLKSWLVSQEQTLND